MVAAVAAAMATSSRLVNVTSLGRQGVHLVKVASSSRLARQVRQQLRRSRFAPGGDHRPCWQRSQQLAPGVNLDYTLNERPIRTK